MGTGKEGSKKRKLGKSKENSDRKSFETKRKKISGEKEGYLSPESKSVGKNDAMKELGLEKSAKLGLEKSGKLKFDVKEVESKSAEKKGGSGADKSFMTNIRFDSFPVSPNSIQALHETLGYELCTQVQAATIGVILAGHDVLAKAKTGTGKTIAFLLPSLEAMLKAETLKTNLKQRVRQAAMPPIRILVVCPTRELATQVGEESKLLLSYHKGCGTQLVFGGTKMAKEVTRLRNGPCQILVATPGRLLDHINNTEGVKEQLLSLQTLILDECDQLLDMGFRKDLSKIISFLPQERQTLLFSATMPEEVQQMGRMALRENHEFIDTVGKDTSTNLQVRQEVVVAELEEQLPTIFHNLNKHMEEEEDYKVLVFGITARQTQLMAEISRFLKIKTLEIHSRKSQSHRTKVSDEFRNSSGKVVMFTSDVSARGVDYPNVTLVLQVGIPSDKAQYVHRLGRTGRAGKEGRGILLLSPFETFFLNKVSDLPILSLTPPDVDDKLKAKVQKAVDALESDLQAQAYQSFLGFYKSVKNLGWDKNVLVKKANFYSEIIGCSEPPWLERRTVQMMGLMGVRGLNVKR